MNRYIADVMTWHDFQKYDPSASQVIQESIQTEQDYVVLAPTVGVYYPAVNKKRLYQGDASIGFIEMLANKQSLVLPAHMPVVHIQTLSKAPLNCAYKQVVAIAHVVGEDLGSEAIQTVSNQSTHALDLPVGAFAIEAPIDGMLYYTASPDTPSFVNVGDIIEPQTVLALIEVMKFFYEIKYEGTDPVKVCHRSLNNAESIEAGQAIYYLVALD